MMKTSTASLIPLSSSSVGLKSGFFVPQQQRQRHMVMTANVNHLIHCSQIKQHQQNLVGPASVAEAARYHNKSRRNYYHHGNGTPKAVVDNNTNRRRCRLAMMSEEQISSSPPPSKISVTETMRLESLQQMQLLQEFYQKQQQQQLQLQQQQQLPLLINSIEEASQYRMDPQHDIQAILLDCDGVVYRTTDATPDAAKCISSLLLQQQQQQSNQLHQHGSSPLSSTQLLFVTNNASTDRTGLRRKLQQILFPDTSSSSSSSTTTSPCIPVDATSATENAKLAHLLLTDDIMIPTSYAAAQYLRQELLLNNIKNDNVQRIRPPSKTHDRGSRSDDDDEQVMNGDIQQDLTKASVHVIGSPGLCHELEQAGFQVTTVVDELDELNNLDDGDNNSKNNNNNKKPVYSMTRDELAAFPFDTLYDDNYDDPSSSSSSPTSRLAPTHDLDHPTQRRRVMAAMVIGLDTKFHYRKLCIANVLLQRHPQALCVATNMDTHDLVGADGRHLPGNGSIVSCVAYASQRQFVDVGKPSHHLANLVMTQLEQLRREQQQEQENTFSNTASEMNPKKQQLLPSQCLMVGDRLDTDIAFANKNGMKSALVLTGVTTAQDVIDIILQRQQQQMQQDGNDNNNNSSIDMHKDSKCAILPDIILPYLGLLSA